MRIPSGSTDRYIYFVAVDATDLNTRETGLSSFTVYRSRNGGAAAVMTTPTINETDATNMPGVYELLLDEDTTIGAGNDTEELSLHITHAGMAPVTRAVELYRPKITEGSTLTASKVEALPTVTAGAAGGLFIAGTNAATTITSSSGSALTLSSTGSNGAGLSASGNGTAPGIRGTGGATGQGILGVGGATSGSGIRGTATAGNSAGVYGVGSGTGAGVQGLGGATGQGILGVGGATSGAGIRGTGTAGNSHGIYGVGQGSGSGVTGLGGATGHGVHGQGGTNGDGIRGDLGGTGVDIRGNITGNVSGSVGSVSGHTPQTGDTFALANGANGFVAIKGETASILTDTGTDIPALIGTVTDLGGGATLADNLADIAGATFATATDSLEAIRDRGDAAWTGGGGGGDATAANQATIIAALGTVTDLGGGATIADNLADMAGATFATGTDSLEAIRNQGDSAWITATSVTVSDKAGFKLASDGLDLIIPADPGSTLPTFSSSIVAWQGFFAQCSIGEFNVTNTEKILRNSADTADLATYAHSDDGTTLISGPAT